MQKSKNYLDKKLKIPAHGSEGSDKVKRTSSRETVLILILEIAMARGYYMIVELGTLLHEYCLEVPEAPSVNLP